MQRYAIGFTSLINRLTVSQLIFTPLAFINFSILAHDVKADELPANSSFKISLPDSSQTQANSETPNSELVESLRMRMFPQLHYHASVGVLTSVSSQKNDPSAMKGAADESGGFSDNSSLPNMTYMSAVGFIRYNEENDFRIGGLQSLNTPEQRTLVSRSGRATTLPNEILSLSYRRELRNGWFSNARAVYIDTMGMGDPSLGIGQHIERNDNHASTYSLSLFAPTSAKSQAINTLTKSLIQARETWRSHRWTTIASLGYAHLFFAGNAVLPQPAQTNGTAANPAGFAHSSKHSGGNQKGAPARAEELMRPTELDLLSYDREIDRVSAGWGESFKATSTLALSFGAGLAAAKTLNGKQNYRTTAQIIGVDYTNGDWRMGTGLGLCTDDTNKTAPAFPNQWNVGMSLARSFGEDLPIRR